MLDQIEDGVCKNAARDFMKYLNKLGLGTITRTMRKGRRNK
jgi:hypothetical protein